MKKEFLAVLGACLLSSQAHAATIYTNAQSGDYYGWASGTRVVGGDLAVTDDFKIDFTGLNSASLTGLTWAGYYFDTAGNVTSGAAENQTFLINIFSDYGNFEQYLTTTSLTSGVRQTYNVALNQFTLKPGSDFTLVIRALNPARGNEWSWEGRGTNGNALQYDTDEDEVYELGTEQTFSLLGTVVPTPTVVGSVPEPATWAMMLVGFGFVAGAARYRRRKSIVTFA